MRKRLFSKTSSFGSNKRSSQDGWAARGAWNSNWPRHGANYKRKKRKQHNHVYDQVPLEAPYQLQQQQQYKKAGDGALQPKEGNKPHAYSPRAATCPRDPARAAQVRLLANFFSNP